MKLFAAIVVGLIGIGIIVRCILSAKPDGIEYTVEFYRDKSSEWRWRATHQNGNIIADSAESYKRRNDCKTAFWNMAEAIRENRVRGE